MYAANLFDLLHWFDTVELVWNWCKKSVHGFNSSILLWLLLKGGDGNVAVFWDWNGWLLASERLSLDADISDIVGSFCVSGVLRIVFVQTCTSSSKHSIRVELVEVELSITSLGSILSLVSVLFLCGFERTEVVCVWSWEPISIFGFAF